MRRVFVVLVLFLSLAQFENLSADDKRNFQSFPQKLSEWKIFVHEGRHLKFREGSFPYALVNELFTDYARKYRTVWLPENTKIQYTNTGSFEFPKGAILTKTFAYARDEIEIADASVDIHNLPNKFTGNAEGLNGKHLIETRLLIHTNDGWKGLTYVWNDEQSDAVLKLAGSKRKLTLTRKGQVKEFWYNVPNFNQCQACHSKQEDFSKIVQPIGLQAKNTNFSSPFQSHGINQLDAWKTAGKIDGLAAESNRPKMVSWEDATQSLNLRARGYLDSNCAHCHNTKGAGRSSGLFLNYFLPNSAHTGICKSPVAAGNGGYGGKFDIAPGDPTHSILYNRMRSLDPGIMMPELGRSLAHEEADQLIFDWISSLTGSCSI